MEETLYYEHKFSKVMSVRVESAVVLFADDVGECDFVACFFEARQELLDSETLSGRAVRSVVYYEQKPFCHDV